MRHKIGARLQFSVSGPSRVLLHVRATGTAQQSVERESLHLTPGAGVVAEPPGQGRSDRMAMLEATGNLEVAYDAVVNTFPDLRPAAEVASWPPAPLDPARAAFLFPSRYCESDQLGRLAWSKFGAPMGPYARACAVVAWIHSSVAYLRGSTDAGTSACATLVRRAGVCRDFAHLGAALCRALNLPARYVTGYARGLRPQDMHAWFEVAIGDHWVAFDATRLAAPGGLVRVAHGRDAADTAISTSFGPALAGPFSFSCEAAGPGEEDPPRGVPGEEPVLVSKT